MSSNQFADLALKSELVNTLKDLDYQQMTAIQALSLPIILDGKDVIAQAKTGSGKTCAFTLGLLQKLDVKRFRIQAMVICPTRELADQVASEIRKLARGIHNIKVLTLCGGSPLGPQIGSLEHGAHIIVGTPGRLLKHLGKNTLSMDNIETLVLDEADRMLDMGFKEDIEELIDAMPKERQTLLFSATYPEQIESMAKRILRAPERLTVADGDDKPAIEQLFYHVDDDKHRRQALADLLFHFIPQHAVVFCNTKRECQDISDFLSQKGFGAAALHGDMDQKERDQTLIRFANHSVTVLLATDVAARGLDIDNLDMVINYQLARDEEVHVHRIGRTGRAGNSGRALSLFSNYEQEKRLKLEIYLDQSLPIATLPQPDKIDPIDLKAPMITLHIDGGKKQKLRPGDIVGALTAGKAMSGDEIGKIKVMPTRAYVAVPREKVTLALKQLAEGKIKGRTFRARQIR